MARELYRKPIGDLFWVEAGGLDGLLACWRPGSALAESAEGELEPICRR